MARFHAQIRSPLSPDEAFARMAAFDRVPEWDPATSKSTRLGDAAGLGAEHDVTTRFGGRTMVVRYRTTVYQPGRRFVVEATLPNGVGLRDEITVAPEGAGSVVTYDARIVPKRFWRLSDPILHLIFTRLGARAVPGIRTFLGGNVVLQAELTRSTQEPVSVSAVRTS
jgi:hypothetical protein